MVAYEKYHNHEMADYILSVVLLQWVLAFLNALFPKSSSICCRSILFTALFGAIFGLFLLSDGLKLLVPSFILWLVPNVSEWLICCVIDLGTAMNNAIKS